MSAAMTNVATNIPESDQIGLAETLFLARSKVTMETLPGTPDDATGQWILDQSAWDRLKEGWSER